MVGVPPYVRTELFAHGDCGNWKWLHSKAMLQVFAAFLRIVQRTSVTLPFF